MMSSLAIGVTTRSSSELGAALARARREAGLDQEQLALWAGVSREYVSELERAVHATKVERLFRVLNLLGLELVIRRKQPL
jgi:HTH-type transcriptional regulator/antitoxin HipB